MPFAYYENLSPEAQAIYRQSDARSAIRLPRNPALRRHVDELRLALEGADRAAVESTSQAIAAEIAEALHVEPPGVKVLEARPRIQGGELHGLYTEVDDEPWIVLWMRTRAHEQVVAFRTFLRTLLHEILHHLDFTLLDLPISFHTLGFFRRESSLFHQLVPR